MIRIRKYVSYKHDIKIIVSFLKNCPIKAITSVLKVSSTQVLPWFLGAVRVGHLLALCIVFVFVRDLCPMLVCVS
jgi:hypothetical protein